MAIVERLRDYLITCPHFDDLAKLNINFLPKDTNNYSITEVQNKDSGIVAKYLDGTTVRKYDFNFDTIFNFSEELKMNIKNSEFFEKFQEWIEDNNRNEILPTLDSGMVSSSIEVTSSGELFFVSKGMDKVIYRIELRLEYEKEK